MHDWSKEKQLGLVDYVAIRNPLVLARSKVSDHVRPQSRNAAKIGKIVTNRIEVDVKQPKTDRGFQRLALIGASRRRVGRLQTEWNGTKED